MLDRFNVGKVEEFKKFCVSTGFCGFEIHLGRVLSELLKELAEELELI